MCWKLAIQYKPPDYTHKFPLGLYILDLSLESLDLAKTLVVLKSNFSLLFWKQGLPSLVGCQRALRPAVAEPPKRLGPGALIFVAKQLGPKLARTGSSSSEASIKATLFQDCVDKTHTKVSPEITTQNISYISEWLQWKINLLQTKFRVVKYYRVQLLKLFKSHCFSRSSKR